MDSIKFDDKENCLACRNELFNRAACKIENAWISYKNRRLFKLLKNSICAAESAITPDILKRLNPREAAFLKDQGTTLRVRFRFGGDSFPPRILFKVYISSRLPHADTQTQPQKQSAKPSSGIVTRGISQQTNPILLPNDPTLTSYTKTSINYPRGPRPSSASGGGASSSFRTPIGKSADCTSYTYTTSPSAALSAATRTNTQRAESARTASHQKGAPAAASAMRVKYMTGRDGISLATGASEAARKQMGNRLYAEMLARDGVNGALGTHARNSEIVSTDEIVTFRDYMKYVSRLDELPADLGGKNNAWRCLTLEDVPQHTVFRDLIEYSYHQFSREQKRADGDSSGVMSARLLEAIPILLQPATDSSILLEQMRCLTNISQQSRYRRTPESEEQHAKHVERLETERALLSRAGEMQLRARQAKERAARLRGTWLAGAGGEAQSTGRTPRTQPSQHSAPHTECTQAAAPQAAAAAEHVEDAPLEQILDEGRELYEWTQALTVSSLGFE